MAEKEESKTNFQKTNVAAILSCYTPEKGPVPIAMTSNWDKILTNDEMMNLIMWAEVTVGAFDENRLDSNREHKIQGPLKIPVRTGFISTIFPFVSPDDTMMVQKIYYLILILNERYSSVLLEKLNQLQLLFRRKFIHSKSYNTNILEEIQEEAMQILDEEEDYLSAALKQSVSWHNEKQN